MHMVKSLTLNPYMSLFNLKLCTHIWSTNINFRPPPLHWTFRSVLCWTFTLWVNCGRGVGWACDIFFVTDGQKRDYLSCSSQHARGATKNLAIATSQDRVLAKVLKCGTIVQKRRGKLLWWVNNLEGHSEYRKWCYSISYISLSVNGLQ